MKIVLFYFWIGGFAMSHNVDKVATFNNKEDCEMVKTSYLKQNVNGNYICAEEDSIRN